MIFFFAFLYAQIKETFGLSRNDREGKDSQRIIFLRDGQDNPKPLKREPIRRSLPWCLYQMVTQNTLRTSDENR